MEHTEKFSELVAEYYNQLSRYVRFTNLLKFGNRYADFTMHKPLNNPEEISRNPHDINNLTLSMGELPPQPKVLDAGCGFGGTIFHWYKHIGGTYDGLTLSQVQHEIAQRQARHLGIDMDCRFYLKSYDEPPPSTYDTIIAIESLIHSPNLEKSLSSLTNVLKSGGKFIVVDDVVRDDLKLHNDEDKSLVKFHWNIKEVYSEETYHMLFKKNNLRILQEIDLTKWFSLMRYPLLHWIGTLCRSLYIMLPLSTIRSILSSYIGGMALQRLYHRKFLCYKLFVGKLE
jgi:SAM-dependent methyltransferase